MLPDPPTAVVASTTIAGAVPAFLTEGATASSPAALAGDPALLSRIQFAWTITIHIVFASLSVGLAPLIVYFTYREVRTGDERFAALRSFWVKVFALGFALGTATGIPMSFQFGTNFSVFSEFAGELIGGPLAFEAKTAFFLEAVFLGVLLFGRERVSDRAYLASSVLVAIGAWLSAFWIIVVNSWMQTPQGFKIAGGAAEMTDPMAAIFTPRLSWMYVHMQLSAVISVALLVAGVGAYLLWKHGGGDGWRTAVSIALVVLLLTAPVQALQGDAYVKHVQDTQPTKFASMEAHYETSEGAALHVIAFPTSLEGFTDPRAENLWTLSVPTLLSYLLEGNADAEVVGLNEFEHTPPVAIVFWSFRIMVGLGMWFVFLGLWGWYRRYQGRLAESDRLLGALMLSTPLGFLAMIAGWYTTEVGRQPWMVQNELLLGESVSPGLTGAEATVSVAAFVLVFGGLFLVFLYALRRLIAAESDRLSESVGNRPTGPEPSGPVSTRSGGGDP
ncbi:MAG: cytochrome ubiquinol oxidase subunit I [Haloferacaceae archaeon]